MEDHSSLLEKISYLKRHGKFLTCKHYIQVNICLYKLNQEFVEIWYHMLGDVVLRVETVSQAFVEQRYFSELETGGMQM